MSNSRRTDRPRIRNSRRDTNNRRSSRTRQSMQPRSRNTQRGGQRRQSSSVRRSSSSRGSAQRSVNQRNARRPSGSRGTRSRSGNRTNTTRSYDFRDIRDRRTNSSRPRSQSRPSQQRSVTVGQIERDRRREQRRENIRQNSAAYARFRHIFTFVLVVVIALIVSWFALSNSTVFSISQVQVQGANHLSEQQISDMASIPANSSLLNVDTSGIESRLRENPWVRSVHIHRVFPNTLEIDITERTIQAVVEVPSSRDQSTQDWILSSDGIWLMQIPDANSDEGRTTPQRVYDDANAALHITDVPYGVSPEVGATVSDPSIQNALDIITGLTTSLSQDVSSISASSPSNAVLSLNNGVQIAFGTSEDIREKERVCQQLLSEHEGQISYINVRTVNRPTWRGLSS